MMAGGGIVHDEQDALLVPLGLQAASSRLKAFMTSLEKNPLIHSSISILFAIAKLNRILLNRIKKPYSF